MMLLFVAAVALTCDALPGFTQDGKSRMYEGESLFEYMDGNSEGYLAYGFVRMHGVTCTKGSQKVLIDVSEMPDAECAYGLFSSNRDVKLAAEQIGTGGQVVPRKAIFVKDKYFIELAAEAEGDHTALLRAGALAMNEKIPGSTALPEQLGWFPEVGLTAGPPRLVPQSVLGVRALKRGYMAQYGPAKVFVVSEASKEAAHDVITKWLGRYEAISEGKVEGADEAFLVGDKYLGRIVVARRGGRIVGSSGGPEAGDPTALVKAVLARVPK